MVKGKYIGEKKVEIQVNKFNIKADLPVSFGGKEEYPSPLDLLQAALLSCATMHAMLFMQKMELDPAQLKTELEPVFNENNTITEASILLYVSDSFPQEREKALIGAVENCIVGRHVNFPRKVILVRNTSK